MFAKQALNELASRRRLLVMEADLLRGCLGLEHHSLRARLAALRVAPQSFARHRPLLIAGSLVASLLAMRRKRTLARWLPVAVTGFRWLRALKGN